MDIIIPQHNSPMIKANQLMYQKTIMINHHNKRKHQLQNQQTKNKQKLNKKFH